MKEIAMDVRIRKEKGKEACKGLRERGFIPAVIYGKGEESLHLECDKGELFKILHTRAGENVVVNLKISSDGQIISKTALVKEVQHDPLKGEVLHVDFNHISLTQLIRVEVPVEAKGESKGVKEGGVLEHILWQVEVECLPTQIPEKIDVRVDALDIGDSIHVRELIVPTGVKILTDPEMAVISVEPPKVEKPAEEEVEEEAAEPEVIREKPAAPEEEEKEEKKPSNSIQDFGKKAEK